MSITVLTHAGGWLGLLELVLPAPRELVLGVTPTAAVLGADFLSFPAGVAVCVEQKNNTTLHKRYDYCVYCVRHAHVHKGTR